MELNKNLLEIGKIVTIFGLKGEVKVQPWCDDPQLLCELETLYWRSGTPVTVERARVQKNMAVVKIAGIDTPEDAQKLRNHVLYMDRRDVELPEGSWFVADLLGLEVYGTDGVHYGTLSDVTETGANDVYHVHREGEKDLLIPAIPSVIDSISLDEGKMTVILPDGLLAVYRA